MRCLLAAALIAVASVANAEPTLAPPFAHDHHNHHGVDKNLIPFKCYFGGYMGPFTCFIARGKKDGILRPEQLLEPGDDWPT